MNQLMKQPVKLLNIVRCQQQKQQFFCFPKNWCQSSTIIGTARFLDVPNNYSCYSTKSNRVPVLLGFRFRNQLLSNSCTNFQFNQSNSCLIRWTNSIARQHEEQDNSLTFAKNKKRYSKKRSPFGYIFVLLPIATFCFGTWQVYRRQWKLDLIEKLESLIDSAPIDFPERLSDLNDMEYSKVKVRGYLDQSTKPIFVFPRTIITDNQPNKKKSQYEPGTGLFSTSNSSRVGAQLIMPFVVSENQLIVAYNEQMSQNRQSNQESSNQEPFRILVNLGWVSRETMEKINQHYATATEEQLQKSQNQSNLDIQLIGIVRKTEKREPFKTKQESNYGYWNRRDIPKMSSYLETSPVFLDSYESYPVSLLNNTINVEPIGGQTRVCLRNEHLSYIITWYSLTGIFSYLWYKKIFKIRL